jgi:hypothetical protein
VDHDNFGPDVHQYRTDCLDFQIEGEGGMKTADPNCTICGGSGSYYIGKSGCASDGSAPWCEQCDCFTERTDSRDILAYILRATLYWPCAIGLLAIVLYGFWYFISCMGCL